MSETESDQVSEDVTSTDDAPRCTAETEAGGTLYQCALTEDHEGDHAFSPVEESDEPEPEPEPSDDDTPPALDVVDGREKEWDRVRRYLSKNFAEIEGADSEHYAECPYCNATGTPGYMALGPIPDELHGLTYQLLSMRPPADLKKDPYTLQCATCEGEAETRTGSKRAGQETIPCLDCHGKGWVATGPERAGGLLSVSNGPSAASPPPADTSAPMFVPPADEPPEVADLRRAGYVVVAPMHATG